ncbi:MAG: hypothetical protein ACRC62_36655, partial [Microcoleus sp.]
MQDFLNQVIQGDCLDVIRSLPSNSIHAIVSDPPAGISMMGQKWDGDKGDRSKWIAYMRDRF